MVDDAAPVGAGEPAESVATTGAGAPETEARPVVARPVETRRRTGLLVAVAVAVLAADQLSKWWAVNRLPRGIIDIVGSLRLNLAYNTGAAFSLGSGRGLGPVIALLVVVVVVVLVSSVGSARSRLGVIAAGLVIGGALGNLADRAFRGDAGLLKGAVVDFIDLQWWPSFNVADSAVVVGACALVLASLRHEAS